MTSTPRSLTENLTGGLVRVALAASAGETALGPARRARFDYLACLTAGRRVTSLGDPAAACVLDRDDLHWPSVCHPGAIIWPVARENLGAAAAGYEAMIRLALALGPDHRRMWHVTATAGVVGAAVAASVARGLDEETTVEAAGHAVSVAGGSSLAVLEGSGTKVFHRLHAAATGIACAEAAAAGLGATRAGLEPERGLFAATGGDAAQLLAERDRPAIAEASFRIWAATGFAHAAIEAAQELAPVESPGLIEVEVPPVAAALAGNPDPHTDEEAWWSVPYAVAVTLLGLDLEDRSLLADPRVRGVVERIVLRAGETSTVTVDGRSASRARPREATDDDLARKWRTLNPGAESPLELLC